MKLVSYLSNVYFSKPLMHILCSLGIWVFILVLMLMEQNNFMTLRIDQVKTYTLRKIPQKWDMAYSQMISNLNILWTPADDRVCLAGSGATGACPAKRQQIVTSVRQAISCDQLRSAFCSCVNQLLQPVADDLVNFFPLLNGTFFSTSKNVNGTLPFIINGVDACHYLHHGTFVAQQTGDTWLRRTHLLFILSTIITGNAVYQFVILPLCHATYFYGYSKIVRVVSLLIWPLVGAVTAISIEGGTQQLLYWILLPPLLFIVWYEFLLPPLRMDPFIHPYTFSVTMSILVVTSLVENSVLDYNILWTEVWKCHLVTCLYFGICWFHLFMDNDPKESKHGYLRRSAQDTVYITLIIGVLVVANTTMAPYAVPKVINMLWWLPSIFVFLSFINVIWMSQNDRFSDFHSDLKQEQYQRMVSKPGYINTSSLYTSCALLILVSLYAIYYWRDFAQVVFSIWQKIPTRSIQVSQGTAWLDPIQ
jgi:hypothetical protein